MTAKELAAKLTGREVGGELFPDEKRDAEEAGLVVVYGHSDDNVKFSGAINDYMAVGGGNAPLNLEAVDNDHGYRLTLRLELVQDGILDAAISLHSGGPPPLQVIQMEHDSDAPRLAVLHNGKSLMRKFRLERPTGATLIVPHCPDCFGFDQGSSKVGARTILETRAVWLFKDTGLGKIDSVNLIVIHPAAVGQHPIVVMDTDGKQQIVYKHAISTIMPWEPRKV